MSTPKQDQDHDWIFTLSLDGLAPSNVRVTEFEWQEDLSKLYQGTVHFSMYSPLSGHAPKEFIPTEYIDTQTTLKIHHKYHQTIRHLTGIITRIEHIGFSKHWSNFILHIQPELARLELTSDSRIFQQTSVPDIIKKIFKEHGIINHEFRLQDPRPPREYCVQYNETHLAFIERLLAEEGIFYYWEYTQHNAKLILSDHNAQSGKISDPSAIEYNNTPSGVKKGEFIRALSWTDSLATTELTQRDYSFFNPAATFENKLDRKTSDEKNTYAQYNPIGRYKDGDTSKRFSQYQLDQARTPLSTAKGNSNAIHLSAGHYFSLTDHPSEPKNDSYFITQTTHIGTQPQALEAHDQSIISTRLPEQQSQKVTQYHNTFDLKPFGFYSWRPKSKPKPRIDGSQIAKVVGPPGEEIYCDQYGRVKIQFPWDRRGKNDDQSSCWVRVSQAWAGASWGSIAIPRINQEVIVSFLDGDPDQPIITGRTYHVTNVPPNTLPVNKTKMTIKSKTHHGTGFNELTFDDAKNQEEVFIHAEKDQNNIVKNDETTSVGKDRTEKVGKNETTTIGGNQIETIKQNKAETIFIAKALSVGAGYQTTVGGSKNETVGLSSTEQVGILRKTIVGKRYEIVCGKTKFIMNSDGTIMLEGVKVSINGAQQVEVNGKIVDIN